MRQIYLGSRQNKFIKQLFLSGVLISFSTSHSMEDLPEKTLKRTLDTDTTILQDQNKATEDRLTKIDYNLISLSNTYPNSEITFYSLPQDLNRRINSTMLQRPEKQNGSILTTWHPIKIALFIKENLFDGVFCFEGKQDGSVGNLLKNAQFWNMRISLIWTAPDKSKSNENSEMTIIFNSLNQIKFLNISGNNINDDSLKSLAIALAKNKTLQYLDLSKNKITYQGAKHLADMLSNNKTLKSLDLSNNSITTPEVLKARLKNKFDYLNTTNQSSGATIQRCIRKPHRFRLGARTI